MHARSHMEEEGHDISPVDVIYNYIYIWRKRVKSNLRPA